MNDVAAAALTARSLDLQARLHDEYARGNRAAVLDALDEAVVWTSIAGPELPWGGTHRGRAGVEHYFARIDAVAEVTGYEVERVIGQGEWVTVLAKVQVRHRASGDERSFPKVDVFHLRDGRLLEFREYYDSAAALAWLDTATPGR